MPVFMSLQLDGIENDAVPSRPEALDILSFSWGASNAAGKVVLQDFNFTMKVCKASPQLFLHCVTGQPISNGVLTIGDPDERGPLYQVLFTGILVSSFEQGGGPGGDSPGGIDDVGLNFAAIEVTYRAEDGTVSRGSHQAKPGRR
jgi:type VI secretion system secreted protein Hcp